MVVSQRETAAGGTRRAIVEEAQASLRQRTPSRVPRSGRSGNDGRIAAVLVGPAMFLLACFVLLPAILAFIGALYRIDMVNGGWTWAGMRNFSKVLGDPVVRRSMVNTVVYCGLTIVPSLVLGLALALLANSFRRARVVVRTLMFLPFTANLVAMAVVFRYMLDLRGGFINQALAIVGIGPFNFLGDTPLALPSLAAIGVWRASSLAMMIFLAGLTTIPTAVLEACAMDGVRGVTRLRLVVLPLLRPVIVFVAVLTIVQAVQVFDTVNVLTQGGPQGATETVLTMTWRLGFTYYDLGEAAALSALLLVVLVFVGAARRSALAGGSR